MLASAASDVARFLTALFAGRLLSPASMAEMTSLTRAPVPGSRSDPQVRPYEWRQPSYGLGLMADPAAPWGPICGHNGGGPGYSASVLHAPELGGVTVAALGSEAEGLDAAQVVFEVLDAKGRLLSVRLPNVYLRALGERVDDLQRPDSLSGPEVFAEQPSCSRGLGSGDDE